MHFSSEPAQIHPETFVDKQRQTKATKTIKRTKNRNLEIL